MQPTPSLLTTLKLGIVALALVGVFVLAAIGRIDATTALGSIVVLVTGLTVALGIASSGASQAAGARDAAQPCPAPANDTKAAERGFTALRPILALAVVGAVALLAACLVPPSPAQQITDGSNLDACITTNWGQSVEAIAGECLNSEIPAAVDLVADIEALVEVVAGTAASASPYAGDARVMSAVPAKVTALRLRRAVPTHSQLDRARRIAAGQARIVFP